MEYKLTGVDVQEAYLRARDLMSVLGLEVVNNGIPSVSWQSGMPDNVKGNFDPRDNSVRINDRLPTKEDAIKAMVHEFVHSQQHFSRMGDVSIPYWEREYEYEAHLVHCLHGLGKPNSWKIKLAKWVTARKFKRNSTQGIKKNEW